MKAPRSESEYCGEEKIVPNCQPTEDTVEPERPACERYCRAAVEAAVAA